MSKFELTTEQLLSWQRAAHAYAGKCGYRELADDFAADAVIQALTTGQCDLAWALADFLRKELGATRSSVGRARSNGQRFAVSLDAPTMFEGEETNRHQTIAAVEQDAPTSHPSPLITGRTGIIADLLLDGELTQKEIADQFGVTEGRISQIVTAKVKPALAQTSVLTEFWDEYTDDLEASKLRINWITL